MNLKVYSNILKGILEQMQQGDYISAEENINKIIRTVDNISDNENRNTKEKAKG